MKQRGENISSKTILEIVIETRKFGMPKVKPTLHAKNDFFFCFSR